MERATINPDGSLSTFATVGNLVLALYTPTSGWLDPQNVCRGGVDGLCAVAAIKVGWNPADNCRGVDGICANRVVAPDYRGAGHSWRPPGGYDKRTMAGDIHRRRIACT